MCFALRLQLSEEQLSGELSSERAAVAQLKQQAADVRKSLEQEQQLVAKLKRDMAASNEQSARLVRRPCFGSRPGGPHFSLACAVHQRHLRAARSMHASHVHFRDTR